MDRKGFLRALGLISVAPLIPDNLLNVTDFVEKKSSPKFVNHMSIQRKTVMINGVEYDWREISHQL